MNLNRISFFLVSALVLLAVLLPARVEANVYATDIRFNGSKTNTTAPQGVGLAISYILNEDATAGGTVEVLSGTQVIRTITLTAGQPGTLRGTNAVVWNTKTQSGAAAPVGTYSARVTVAALGEAIWHPISRETNVGYYIFRGTGIAVNQDPTSPSYGQVILANSDASLNVGAPGEENGILRFNSDGSVPAEGAVTEAGPWSGGGTSPWKVEFADNSVYANDLTSGGEFFRWNSLLEPESKQAVLTTANLPNPAVLLSGLALHSDKGTNYLFTADIAPGSLGILRYALTNSGTAGEGNTGEVVVAISPGPNSLDQYPYDVAVDSQGNIYTIQSRFDQGDLSPRVLRFPAYDPSTNAGMPEYTADWAAGSGDETMGQASGLALDPTETYLAVSFRGADVGGFSSSNGCTQIFYASNGVVVTNLDLLLPLSGQFTHQDSDCAWDAVGNVYFIDDYAQVWRTFSPPGPSQATTASVQTIQLTPGGGGGDIEAPTITNITVNSGTVTVTFTSTPGTPAASFSVLSAAVPNGNYTAVPAAVVVATGRPGEYQASFAVLPNAFFFRIQATGGGGEPTDTPRMTGITVNGNSVVVRFVGTSAGAQPVLLSAPTANGVFNQTAAQIKPGPGAGEFEATVATSGPAQFYRVRQ